MNNDMSGKVTIITGGGKGIGYQKEKRRGN